MISIYRRYSQALARRPLLTNILTSGFLFGSGDYLAQHLFSSSNQYDYHRTLRATLFGSIIFAPIADKWYRFLNKLTFPVGTRKFTPFKKRLLDTATRVSVDQLGFAPFIGIPLYYSCMSILEFNPDPLKVAQHRLSVNWWHTLQTNWIVWPVFQLFNFAFIPVQFRLLVVNVLSIGWNCYLSYVLNHKHQTMIEKITDIEEDQILI